MKMVGGDEYEYIYAGKGVMVLSELWHKSLSADKVTVKMPYFMKAITHCERI